MPTAFPSGETSFNIGENRYILQQDNTEVYWNPINSSDEELILDIF